MGYTITIGQLEIRKEPEDGLDCTCISFGAEGVHHDNAPAFGEPTDHENQRWPSYSSWSDFLRNAGLYDIFFYDSGHLIGGHPGIRLVTSDLKTRIDLALKQYQELHPDAEANFDTPTGGTLCRLTWLQYWISWSLENCETPVIANS